MLRKMKQRRESKPEFTWREVLATRWATSMSWLLTEEERRTRDIIWRYHGCVPSLNPVFRAIASISHLHPGT